MRRGVDDRKNLSQPEKLRLLSPWNHLEAFTEKKLRCPPKLAVSHVVGYIKGKSAIAIARHFGGRSRNFTGEVFWARGYFVSTIGLDEAMVREYIRNQEEEDERYDQMKLGV